MLLSRCWYCNSWTVNKMPPHFNVRWLSKAKLCCGTDMAVGWVNPRVRSEIFAGVIGLDWYTDVLVYIVFSSQTDFTQ